MSRLRELFVGAGLSLALASCSGEPERTTPSALPPQLDQTPTTIIVEPTPAVEVLLPGQARCVDADTQSVGQVITEQPTIPSKINRGKYSDAHPFGNEQATIFNFGDSLDGEQNATCTAIIKVNEGGRMEVASRTGGAGTMDVFVTCDSDSRAQLARLGADHGVGEEGADGKDVDQSTTCELTVNLTNIPDGANPQVGILLPENKGGSLAFPIVSSREVQNKREEIKGDFEQRVFTFESRRQGYSP